MKEFQVTVTEVNRLTFRIYVEAESWEAAEDEAQLRLSSEDRYEYLWDESCTEDIVTEEV